MTPILITSSILGVIYYVKQTTTKKYITQDDAGLSVDENDDEIIATSRFDRNIKYKKSEIFPEMRIEDIYSYIEIEDNLPVLSKNIVSVAIKIIVTGLGVTFGELFFEWQFPNKQVLNLYSYWYEVEGDKANGFQHLLMENYSIKTYIKDKT